MEIAQRMNHCSPTVSVIIPCYNGAVYLRETLQSAANQTQPPLEVIVVDDGSTDDSAAIAESFGPPVRVLRQANQGESVARNAGIAAAQGEYLLFLDADDLLEPDALERLAQAVDDVPGGVALMGACWFDDDPGQPFRAHLPKAKAFFPDIIRRNIGLVHSWLVPRQVVLDVGGFGGEIQQYEDWDLWCRIGLTGAPLVTIDYAGAHYRRHAQAQTKVSAQKERARGHAAVLERLATGMLERPELLAAHGETLFWSTWTALHRGREYGLSWKELSGLVNCLEEIVRRGPAAVRSTRFGKLIRLFGVRWAEMIRSALSGSSNGKTQGPTNHSAVELAAPLP